MDVARSKRFARHRSMVESASAVSDDLSARALDLTTDVKSSLCQVGQARNSRRLARGVLSTNYGSIRSSRAAVVHVPLDGRIDRWKAATVQSPISSRCYTAVSLARGPRRGLSRLPCCAAHALDSIRYMWSRHTAEFSGVSAVQHTGNSAIVRRRDVGAAEADGQRLAAAVASVHVRHADDQGSHVLQLSPHDHRAAV